MHTEKEKEIEQLATKILSLARDSIVVNMRFMDVALAGLQPVVRKNSGCVYCDGSKLYYDPLFILKGYKEESNSIVHLYMHILFHCIFYHQFQYDRTETEYWDLAVDIAVENTVLEMGLAASAMKKDRERLDYAEKFHYNDGSYRYFYSERVFNYG